MKATLLIGMLLALGCGNDHNNRTIDAPVGAIDAAVDAAPLMLTCASYCAGNLAACTAANSQWGSMQNCMDTCSHWIMGTMGDTTGNTLACRVSHTMLAQTSPAAHCVHSGPTGGGQCGTTTCADFCPLENAICTNTYAANGANSCASLCPGFGTTGQAFSSADQSGNTIECRFYHLTEAASDPTTHCPHTAQNGGGICQ
jgi:hypothetical protein